MLAQLKLGKKYHTKTRRKRKVAQLARKPKFSCKQNDGRQTYRDTSY